MQKHQKLWIWLKISKRNSGNVKTEELDKVCWISEVRAVQTCAKPVHCQPIQVKKQCKINQNKNLLEKLAWIQKSTSPWKSLWYRGTNFSDVYDSTTYKVLTVQNLLEQNSTSLALYETTYVYFIRKGIQELPFEAQSKKNESNTTLG